MTYSQKQTSEMKIYINADSIVTPIGFGTQENLAALCSYRSGLTNHTTSDVSDTPIVMSEFHDHSIRLESKILDLESQYTKFERLVIMAITDILDQTHIDLEDKTVGIVISTTKGNSVLIDHTAESQDGRVSLWKTSDRIGRYFGAANRPIIVSNACISGLSAMIVGKRLIEAGVYESVIVAGCDVLTHFITSGFKSFKSLSAKRCVPFDARRDGLNLGEGAGAVLLSPNYDENSILLAGGAISNDANHISGPSRTGYELNLAIRGAMREAGVEPADISFVNTHGTATVYNDEMESKAVTLAELQNCPVQSLKPYFGHTLGASGIIEAIVCAHELRMGTVFGTFGYEKPGTPMPLKVSAEHQRIRKMRHCVKTASGFGGCNAAIVLSLPQYAKPELETQPAQLRSIRSISVFNSQIKVGKRIVFSSKSTEYGTFIREAFKKLGDENLKFYKMDNLCKLGYVAAGYLLNNVEFKPEEMGIIVMNAVGSLDTDLDHERIISEQGDAMASPSVFVYTLPNVVVGEICIRYKIKGENTFFIREGHESEVTMKYIEKAMERQNLRYCITGWLELIGSRYRVNLNLLENTGFKGDKGDMTETAEAAEVEKPRKPRRKPTKPKTTGNEQVNGGVITTENNA